MKIHKILPKEFMQRELQQLEYNPDSFENLHSLTTRYVINKQYYECLNILEKIEEIHGGNSQHYLNKSLCLYRLGEIKEAIESVEESLQLDSDNIDSKKLLSKLQERLKSLADYTMGIYA